MKPITNFIFIRIKFCAVFTAICFIISTAGSSLYALPISQNIDNQYEYIFNRAKMLNTSYGKITSVNDVGSDVTVINIQDLHCHPQTQKNISKIISQIADKYNLTKIYVEGGYGKISADSFNIIKDKSLRIKIIESLLEQGILTGSEYYKLTSDNNVEFLGLDDEKIHKDNVNRLAWILSREDKYKQVVNDVKQEIEILGNIYTNKANRKFSKVVEKYSANKIDSKKFYKELLKYVKYINDNPKNNETFIGLADYPNIKKMMTLNLSSKNVNIKTVSYQLSMVLNELKNKLPYSVYTKLLKETDNLKDSQKIIELIPTLCEKEGICLTQYKALNEILSTNNITKVLNPVELLYEERHLVSEIRKALSYNDEEYEITFLSDFYKYFQNYLEYNLTDSEWKYLVNNYDKFRFLYSKYAVFDGIIEIEKDFSELDKYYNINDQRNNIFVNNLLRDEKISLINSKDVRYESEILKNSKEVIIAITGGFHSDELEKRLTEKNVNTIIVTPSVYGSVEKANEKYVELIEQQSKINSQALQYTLFSCSDNNYQKILFLKAAAKELKIENVQQLSKILGININFSEIDKQEWNNVSEEKVNMVSSIIKTAVDEILQNAILSKNIITCNNDFVDTTMLNMVSSLVENGFYFNRGAIYDLEETSFNDENIKGISPSISHRLPKSLQKALLQTAKKETKFGFGNPIKSLAGGTDDISVSSASGDMGEDLTEEEKEALEVARVQQEDYYNSIYTYRPDKKLQKDVEEIFNNLVNAMVELGWITEKERSQYKLHYFYNPTANAFTIINSKDVYLFSQLLYEINKDLKKHGKRLTKDMIAAILAHELRHTIQKYKKYDYKNKNEEEFQEKGSDKRKEYDADTGGLELMDMAGYNPKAMQRVIEYFCDVSSDSILRSVTGLLCSHPNSKNRLKVISGILQSKDVAFMNMDKQEQSLTARVKKYFKFRPAVTKFLLSKSFPFIRIIVFKFLASDKSKYFTNEEKEFLKKVTKTQRKYLIELIFNVGYAYERLSNYSIDYLSKKEKEEIFDFIVDKMNIMKIKNLKYIFYPMLIPSIDMTPERWEKFNKHRKIHGVEIGNAILKSEDIWFYAKNNKYLSDMEKTQILSSLLGMNSIFLERYDNKEYIKLVYSLISLKDVKPAFHSDSTKIIEIIKNADYFTYQEKLNFIYLLSVYSKDPKLILEVLEFAKNNNIAEKLINLCNLTYALTKNKSLLSDWYNYIIEKYVDDLSICGFNDLEKIAVNLTKVYNKNFSPFILGWFVKFLSPDKKIYFVNSEDESKNPKYSDGICLWPGIFSKWKNYEKIVNSIDVSGFELIDKLKSFQSKLEQEGIITEEISFITYQILQKNDLWDKYKYDLKYLLSSFKNQDKIQIKQGKISSYPIQYVKDVVEIIFPQANIDLGEKSRVTQYFIHLAELQGLSVDYKTDSLKGLIEKINQYFDVSKVFFKKDSDENYTFKELETITAIEDNFKKAEIQKVFIYKLHEIFGLEPELKSINFDTQQSSYNYDYFEINKTLSEQKPTVEQHNKLINIFSSLKKELAKENTELYAKLIYMILKNNLSLPVFSSAEENIKILDFLFEDFSKFKDDYINELLDKYDITPEQYEILKKKITLARYEQITKEEDEAVAKEELIYFVVEHLPTQEDRINFLLWLMSSEEDSKFYRTYTLGNVECKDNNDVKINFDDLRMDFMLMTKSERENVIRTVFVGSAGILNKKTSREENINKVVNGLQNILFNNLFFNSQKTDALNIAMANMFNKIFEIVFKNVNDERKVVFVNNLYSALIDIKTEMKNIKISEGELRARQLGRLIVAMGVNSGMAVLKLLQILSNNKVFEQLDARYGKFINEEVSKVKSENEPLSKFVIFKYLERLGLLDKVEYVGKCLGSASIGLTYLVKFKGKNSLDVVKIKRPNIMKNYDEDFAVFEKIRQFIVSKNSPLPDQYKKMIPKTKHLQNIFDDELDFETESENLKEFAEQLKKRNSSVRVPDLVNEGEYIFTQTAAAGVSLDKLQVSQKEKKKIYIEILKELFTEVFADAEFSSDGTALYHADLHEGNIFVDEKGNITFIDLGGVGKVNKNNCRSLKKIFIFLCMGNYEGFVSSLREYNKSIVRQLGPSDRVKIKDIIERSGSLESKFTDLFEIFNSLENMDKNFLMFMQSLSKVAAYIDELELIDENGKINIQDILEYGEIITGKNLKGLDIAIEGKIENIKNMAIALYLGKYNNFINALNLYNSQIFIALTEEDKEKIMSVMEDKISLQNKIKTLIEIFKQNEKVNRDILLILETADIAVSYIGEKELKDIITKLVVSGIKGKLFHFFSKKNKKQKVIQQQAEEKEVDSFVEVVLNKCENLSDYKRKEIEDKLISVNKDAVRKCLKNSTVSMTVKNIIDFIDIVNYLYDNNYINSKNETDKINLLFKTITVFNFGKDQIKELFEIENAVHIDEILHVLENVNKEKERKARLEKFLNERNKLDLEEMDVEILKLLLNSTDEENSFLSVITLLPTKIAKKLWKNKEKLLIIASFVNIGSASYKNLSFLIKLMDLPNDVLEVLSNNRWYRNDDRVINWDYIYDLNRFCDLYKNCYDKDKFYNTHRFVICLLNFTAVKDRNIPDWIYGISNKIVNISVLIKWKIYVLFNKTEIFNKPKKLSKKNQSIEYAFSNAKDMETLEELSKLPYREKIDNIIKETQRMNIFIDINDRKFEVLLKCFDEGLSVTKDIRTKIGNIKDDVSYLEAVDYIESLLSKRTKLQDLLRFFDKYAHIWEEILFRVAPLIVVIFNPLLGLCLYIAVQVIFIALHIIPKLIGGKSVSDALSETKELAYSSFMIFGYIFTLLLGLNSLLFSNEYIAEEMFGLRFIIPGIISFFSFFVTKVHKEYNKDSNNPLSIARTILNIKKTDNNSNVYIIDDIESVNKDLLENTGLKIRGHSIYWYKDGKSFVFGAKGATKQEITETLKISEQFKSLFSIDLHDDIKPVSVSPLLQDLSEKTADTNHYRTLLSAA